MLENNFDEMAARGRPSPKRARRINLILIYLFVCIHQGHGIGFTSIYKSADHYWPMKNISDNTSLDVVGSAHASIKNGAKVNSTNLFGPAVILDGRDDYILLDLLREDCTNTPSQCYDGFTISFWLYHIRGEFILCTGVYANKNKGPGIMFTYDKGQEIFVLKISTLNYTWKLKTLIPRRKWVHVAFTWSMNEGTQMYLNGKAVVPQHSKKRNVEFESPRSSRGWSIGRPNEIFKLTNYGNFGISHLALWLRELTKSEVATAYAETTSRDWNKVITLINKLVKKQPKKTETKNKSSKQAEKAKSTASNLFTFGKRHFFQATLLVFAAIYCNV